MTARAAIALGQVQILAAPERPERIRIQAVVYDESADRISPIGLTDEALDRVAAAFVGLPVLDRRHEVEAEPGRVIGKVVESRRVGSQIVQVQEWWDADAIRDVVEGVRQGFSISWDPTSANRPVKVGARVLHSDVIPLEVTRTYAPVVHGTSLVAILRSIAMGSKLGTLVANALAALAGEGGDIETAAAQVAEASGLSVDDVLAIAAGEAEPSEDQIEALAAALGVDAGAITAAIEADAAEAPAEDAPPPPPAMTAADQVAAATALRADNAVSLRMATLRRERDTERAERVKLAARVAKIEKERDADKRRVALRNFRNGGWLNGDLAALETALADVPVEHITAVLRHVQPAEPRLPGVVLTGGADAGEGDVEAPIIATAEDIQATALRLSKKTGRSYEDVRREIVNTLAHPSARPRGNA